MKLNVIALAVVLLAASSAQAAGFLLRNQGARASGRANAFVADPSDASAIYHNPAGINNLDGIQVNVGGNVIVPDSTFTGLDGQTAEVVTSAIITPYAYATYELNDFLTFGLGMNPPYGSGLEWDENSPGRQIVREISLQTFYITPTVGIDFDQIGVPGLAFAAGLDLVPAAAYLRQDILFGDQVGQAELSGSDFGVGGRAGITYNPAFAQDLHIGVAYRLPVAFRFEGEGDFDIDDPTLRQSLNPDGSGAVELEVPQVLSVGVAYDILPELQVEVNVDYVGWSVYDELVLTLPSFPETPDQREELILPRNWSDETVFRIGAEWTEETWAVRGGFAYDPTPVPDTTLDFTLPDANRRILTAGVSFQMTDNIGVDSSFWYLFPNRFETSDEPFTPPVKGTYEVGAFVFSLGLNVTFGQPTAPVSDEAESPETEETVQPVAAIQPGTSGGVVTALR